MPPQSSETTSFLNSNNKLTIPTYTHTHIQCRYKLKHTSREDNWQSKHCRLHLAKNNRNVRLEWLKYCRKHKRIPTYLLYTNICTYGAIHMCYDDLFSASDDIVIVLLKSSCARTRFSCCTTPTTVAQDWNYLLIYLYVYTNIDTYVHMYMKYWAS